MSTQLLAQRQTAKSLLAQAKQECIASGELVRQILAGTRRIDSWLIETRIVPALLQQGARLMNFTVLARKREMRAAAIVPLPDGSAFAQSASGRWADLEPLEAHSAIQYIGYRYAPDNDWMGNFTATLTAGGEPPVPIRPMEVAQVWEEVTGKRPAGFDMGAVDEMEALGLKLLGRIFNTRGRLEL